MSLLRHGCHIHVVTGDRSLLTPVAYVDGVADVSVREMTADDVIWAAGLMERRRQVYSGYSPVFWRPRPGVTGLHARFLGPQIARPASSPCAPITAFSLASVTAHADEAKCAMLATLSLDLAEQWWVRELEPAGQGGWPG
jgi:hypothetical protein